MASETMEGCIISRAIRGKDGAVVARFPCFRGVIFIGGLEYDLRVPLHVWQMLVVYLRLKRVIFRPEITLTFRGEDNITHRNYS